jgi:hypothetical protein
MSNQVKTASPELIALLHGNEEFLIADLYTLMLADGTVVGRYTSADINLTVNGNVYYSKSSQIMRGQVSNSIGIDVDSLDVTIYVNRNDTILNLPMVHAFRAGIMDNGIFKCEILFLPDWNNTSIPPVLHFLKA